MRIAKCRHDPHNEKRSRPWLDEETTHYGWDGNRLLLERQGERQQLHIYQPRSFVPLAMVCSEGAQTETQGLPPEYQALKEQYPEQWEATLDKLPRKIAATIRQFEQPENADKSPAEILYYHTDHLGTPRELTDKHGHIVWSATYKAWGNTAKIERPGRLITDIQGNVQLQRWEEQAEPIEQNLRFQGQYYDQETGLHYNRLRYYDPDCGRYINQDPIRIRGGINFYRYAGSPTGFIDPWGLEAVAYKMKDTTLCIGDKFTTGSDGSKELEEFIDRWNKQIELNGGSMTRRVLTPEEEAASRRWKRGKRCECPPGRVPGHVPDAAAGGAAVLNDWMAQVNATNSYVGGLIARLPVGYTYETVKMVTDLGGC